MTHEHDPVEMERAAQVWCDDARAMRVHELAMQIRQELREAHDRKDDIAKMAIRVMLRGWNGTLPWTKCEAAVTRVVDTAIKLEAL